MKSDPCAEYRSQSILCQVDNPPETVCAQRAAEATTRLAFLCWGRRSMAWGLCQRMGVAFLDAYDVVGAVVPEPERIASER